MPCFPLSENTYSVDQSKVFIPFDKSINTIAERPTSLIIDICSFLIITPSDKIIIDPGLGLKQANEEYHIINTLRNYGIEAEDISIVLLSHLHKDHIGGTLQSTETGFKIMFPNARYYVQLGELEYALSKNSSSYEKDKIDFLLHNNYLELLQGNGAINKSIRYEVSGGHTPYHQIFKIEFDKEKYFYGGDVLPQAQQLIRKFIAKYDYDGKLSSELRIEYGKYIAQEDAIALFFHSTSIPMAKINYDSEKFTIQKVEP